MTKVCFEMYQISGDDSVALTEDSPLGDFNNIRKSLLDNSAIDGAVRIEIQGYPPVEVLDELPPLVRNLCFESVPMLLQRKCKCYLYTYLSSADHLVMVPMANSVRIFGEFGLYVTDSLKNLLPELYKCGERFIDLLRKLDGDENAMVKYLQPFALAARTILQEHKLV
jgi:hypothetical protein